MRAARSLFALLLLCPALGLPVVVLAQQVPAEPPPIVEEGHHPPPAPLAPPADATPPTEATPHGDDARPPAHAEGVLYGGPHPLEGGGYCYDEAPHVHQASPSEPLSASYRESEGQLAFVGDPVPYGYEGTVVGYEGAHPLVVPVVSYCYLTTFHYHAFGPDPAWAAQYAFFSGAWRYRGPVTVSFYSDRARYDRAPPRISPAHAQVARLARRFYTQAARVRLAHAGGRLTLRLGAGSAGTMAAGARRRGSLSQGRAVAVRGAAQKARPSGQRGPSSKR